MGLMSAKRRQWDTINRKKASQAAREMAAGKVQVAKEFGEVVAASVRVPEVKSRKGK